MIVQSPSETLNPGQTTFDVDPNGFKATCPAGYTVIGTGFNGSIGNTDFVINFGGFFVGGFVYNSTSIQISGVYLQAMCAAVPQGATAASAGTSRAAMQAKYRKQLKKLERTAKAPLTNP